MTPPIRYAADDGYLRVAGTGALSDQWDTGGFLLGTTKPVATDGCRIPEAQLELDSLGSRKSVGSGDRYVGKLLANGIDFTGTGGLVRDCIIDVPASSVDFHAFRSWVGSGNVVENVTIRCRPENRSYFIGAGVHGAGVKVSRCNISGMTDGFIASSVGTRAGFEFVGNYVDDLVYYPYDGWDETPRRPGSHSDGAHPDGGQGSGKLTFLKVVGNRIAVPRTSGIIATEDAGTYDVGPQITDNWFEYGAAVFGSVINLAKSGMTSMGSAKIQRNRFLTQTTAARMFIRPEYLSAMIAAGGITSTGPDRNVYLDGSGPVPVYNGTTSTTSY